MPSDPSLQRLLDQLSDLYQLAEDAMKKPMRGVAPEVKERLAALQEKVELFKALNAQVLLAEGFTPGQMQNLPPIPAHLDPKEKILLERVNRLARDAKNSYANLSASIKLAQKKKSPSLSRKKKFNRLGGRDQWKPL